MKFRVDASLDAESITLPQLDEVRDALRELCGIANESYVPENGAVQFELTFESADLWEARDVIEQVTEKVGDFLTEPDEITFDKPRERTRQDVKTTVELSDYTRWTDEAGAEWPLAIAPCRFPTEELGLQHPEVAVVPVDEVARWCDALSEYGLSDEQLEAIGFATSLAERLAGTYLRYGGIDVEVMRDRLYSIPGNPEPRVEENHA